MNITNRDQLLDLLEALHTRTVLAVDTETNGLDLYKGHYPISMSFYFPETEQSFNFAWAHGQGEFSIPAANRNKKGFHKWKWTGKGKKQVWKEYWFNRFRSEVDGTMHQNITVNGEVRNWFGNCPMEWLDEIRETWNKHTALNAKVVYFNQPFDTHMMESIGFVQPHQTEDVRIAVSLVFEDFRNPTVGGENRLKWQADYHKIPGALDGEAALKDNATKLAETVAPFIINRWDDEMNSSFHKLKRAAKPEEVVKRLKFDPKSEMWCLPSHWVAEYAENDTRITWLLREHLRGILEQWDQWQLYLDSCAAQGEFAIRMERNGLLLDKDRAEELVEDMAPIMGDVNDWFAQEIAIVLQKMEDAGELSEKTHAAFMNSRGQFSFTVGSSKKLPLAMTLLTGVEWAKCDKAAIEAFEDDFGNHEAVTKLKRYRHAQRAVKTYLKNWITSQDENGYIHFSFNTSGTKTGRWSSSSGTLGRVGNGQNIPSRGFKIKECLVTPPGYRMYQIDYGQIELRLAAWIAGCKTMIDLFNDNADMHAYTRDKANVRAILFPGLTLAEQIATMRDKGKLKNEPTNDEEAEKEVLSYCRAVAKVLNFGLLYGGGWRMVSRLLKLTEQESRQLHFAWNALYPEFAEANAYYTREALTRRARPDGSGRSLLYVTQPLSKRTRKFGFYPTVWNYRDKKTGEWKSFDPRAKEAKDAFNFIVQGLANYIMWQSALKVCRALNNDIFRPWAVIHDSLNFYLKVGEEAWLPWIVETMTDWPTNPKLTADVEVAVDGRWQHLKGIKDLTAYITRSADNE